MFYNGVPENVTGLFSEEESALCRKSCRKTSLCLPFYPLFFSVAGFRVFELLDLEMCVYIPRLPLGLRGGGRKLKTEKLEQT